ncbi:MAG: hypothetical protein OXM03_10335 [Chloroflexota bacterium]|nr:hypothetical protein [Chloroflexota bacterium]MDE2841012.1 hypothetical protein [Chloroflexota bacterium]MDE2930331.1 hypothetical protein [Chloroflexota bacterium]
MTREEVYAAVQTLATEEDLLAASAYVLGLGDAQALSLTFENLIPDCYHKAKSIAQVLHFGHGGIHYCLAAALALDAKDDAAAREVRFAAKRMATNVASFTWPGWDEPGIAITPEQRRQGLMFARYSVRQLHELDPTAAQLAFTYWYLGAHLMADRQYAEALSVFAAALAYNREHGTDPEGRLMLEGYVGLTKQLAGQRECGEIAFQSAVAALEASDSEDAQFYAAQLISARAVFTAPKSP